MAISISTNSSNDIYLGPDKNIVMARNLTAVMQDAEHAMRAQLGEMIYSVNQGIPTLDVVWEKLNIPQFISAGRRTLLRVPNVTQVTNFTAEQVGNVLTYTATIKTIYGIGQISNG